VAQITPFEAIRGWPVIVDASVGGQRVIAIGGGRRGVNVHLDPVALIAALNAEVVDVTDSS
jgi:prolyl-tRNA editing enzyme YbaK/EbsC (Cys-tRNA(Pro) deacylase)